MNFCRGSAKADLINGLPPAKAGGNFKEAKAGGG